jgi:hypothetical protein
VLRGPSDKPGHAAAWGPDPPNSRIGSIRGRQLPQNRGDVFADFLVKKTHNGWLILMILIVVVQSELAMWREQATLSNSSMGNRTQHNYESGESGELRIGKLWKW